MADEKFHLVSNYAPTGDQPQAIEQLVEGVERGDRCQTLLGVTGSGKTFTMANVIARCNRPTLVLAHNKTLAAQLCTEFRSFFPDNAVEYFVSYYDYYQPEAYIPSTDTYIEKDSAINDEIDRLRHSATAALSERRDVIIVASVSCIYSLGDPIDYRSMVISLRPGMQMERDELCRRLVKLLYELNDMNFIRNKYRVHGDIVDIHLAYNDEYAIRVEFFGDEIVVGLAEFFVVDFVFDRFEAGKRGRKGGVDVGVAQDDDHAAQGDDESGAESEPAPFVFARCRKLFRNIFVQNQKSFIISVI